jgi:hypothetical protein
MTIAHVQKAISGEVPLTAQASVAATFGVAVGSGNLVCGLVTWGSGTVTDLASVTSDKGDTAIIVDRVADSINAQSSASFYFVNLTTGPTVITANFSPSDALVRIAIDEYSGIVTASPIDNAGAAHGIRLQSSVGTGADAVTTFAVTTVTNGCLIYGATMTFSTSAATHGTGFAIENNGTPSTNGVGMATEDQVQALASASTFASFTAGTGSTPWNSAVMAFTPAVASGPPPPLTLMGASVM